VSRTRIVRSAIISMKGGRSFRCGRGAQTTTVFDHTEFFPSFASLRARAWNASSAFARSDLLSNKLESISIATSASNEL